MARRPLYTLEEAARFVAAFIQAHGYPPDGNDLAAAFGFAHSQTGRKYLLRLEKAGYIRRGKGLRKMTIERLAA